MMFRQFIQRMGRPTIVASIAALMLAIGATAGSLTPPGAVGSTMHSLANIYDSIASATFDSSGIIANQNGSLMGNLKYIENQMAWASGSNNIWSLTSGNVGIGTTSPAYKLEIGTPGDINLASSGAAYRISGNKVLWIKSPSSNSDTMVGVGAGANLTSGLANTFIGYLAGNIATSSSNNTFIGNNAGQLNRTGSSNLFIGRQAGVNNTYGSNNVFLGGFNAGANNTTGSNNVFIGQIAGQSNSTGVNNTFIGAQAGQASTTGFDNTSLGVFAGQAIGNGNQNTYIGTHAGRNATGNLNTFIGGLTGLAFSTGGANTLLGFGADTTSATASGSVAIGYLAKITASHQLVFGSGTASGSLTDAYFGQGVASVSPEGITFHATGGSGTDNPGAPLRFAGGKATGNAFGGSILFQTSDAGGSGSALQSLTTKMTITAAGNVGIASSSPSEKLSVNGNIRVSGGSVWIGDGSGQFGKSPFGLFPNAVEIATTSHGGLYGSGGGISSVYVMLDSGLGGSGDVGRGGAFSAMSSDGNSALISLVEGVSGTATHMGSGTVTNLHGGYFFSSNYNLGTVATMDGVGTQLDNEGGGTVTNGSGVRIYAPFSSTFTNLFGLFIEAQTAGANSWNIYSDGASTRNYFGGNIGVGTTTPNFNIDVNGVLAASVSGNADLVLNNSQNQDGLFRLRSIGGATSSRLDIMGSASAALVSIASTGYVGIGTTAPITQLHVPGLTRPVIKSTTALTNSAKSVYVQGRYAYVTEIGTTGSLQIFDITNPASPTVTASVSLGAQPYAITVQGQYAYVVDASQNNFRILNVSNPARPTVVSTITTGTQPKAVVVQGRYAYVTSQTSNLLQVIDVANPAAPVIVGSVGIGNATNFGLAVQGRYAYIANTSAKTFQIVDVANPAGPTVVRTVATTGTSPLGIAVEGRYAYIAETGGNEIEVFDISDAANAFSVTTFSTGASSGPFSVFIQDHILYVVTNTSSTMQMIDISNPASPVSFGTISTTTGPWNIFVQGRFAYIGATQGKTFQIIDVGGSYIQQLEAGGLDTSTLNVRGNSQMFNNMDIGGGLVIGRGLQVTGPVSFTGSISGAYNPVVFDATGNVGMGTTHVDAKLELVSAATTTNVASISALSLTSGDVFSIVVPASTSTSGRYLLVQDINGQAYASLGNGGRLALRRDITSHGAQAGCTGSGTPTAGCIDYAESYPTTDSTLSAGEIVAVDPHNLFGVIRAEGSASVLGVISTNPAALITGTALLSGANTNQGPAGTVPVALAGRVPVKLSGSVSAGDHLSLSGTPGVAQKATTAGMTVGIALEDSSGPTVLTFVNTSYWAPEIPKLPDAPQSDGLFATIVAWFRDLLGITFEKGKVQADQLCAGTTCVDSAQLQRLLDMVGGSVPPATPAPSDAPSATPLPTDTAEPVTTNSPSPTPSDTVIPTPDTTTPTPTPTPEATPDVVSGPTDEPLPTSSP